MFRHLAFFSGFCYNNEMPSKTLSSGAHGHILGHMRFFVLSLALLPMTVWAAGGAGFGINNPNLTLLQPLDPNTTSLTPTPGIQILFDYFNTAWPWVLGVATGIGVLQALFGGIQIMLSGSDSGARDRGKEKIMWALAGMLMVGLAGFILRSINPLFFT